MPRRASAAMYSGCSFVVTIAPIDSGHQQRRPHVGVVTPLDDLAGGHRHDHLVEVHARAGHDDHARRRSTGSPAFQRDLVLVRLVQHDVREQRVLGHPARLAQDLDRALDLVAGEHLERMRNVMRFRLTAHRARRTPSLGCPAPAAWRRSCSSSRAPSGRSPRGRAAGSCDRAALRSCGRSTVGDLDVVRDVGAAGADPHRRDRPRLEASRLRARDAPTGCARRGTPPRSPPQRTARWSG